MEFGNINFKQNTLYLYIFDETKYRTNLKNWAPLRGLYKSMHLKLVILLIYSFALLRAFTKVFSLNMVPC